MLTRSYYFLLASIFIICSCQKPLQQEVIPEININNATLADAADMSDMIESVTIVPLKESSDHYMGDVTKLYVCNSKYIVWDRLVTKKILLFDKSGNFIKVIMKTGDAPNETLQINDCWINYKNELEVYDYALKKVYQFDSTFTLSKTIKCQEFYMLNNVMRLPGSDEYVGYAGYISNPAFKGKHYRVSYLDRNLKIKKTEMHYDKRYHGIQWTSITNHFYPYKDSLRLFQSLDNYVYDIDKSGIRKKFKLVYNQNPVPDNLLEQMSDEKLAIIRNINSPLMEKEKAVIEHQKFARFSGIWLEDDKYILITSKDIRSYFFTFINKRTKKEVRSARILYEAKRYKIVVPFFKFQDPETGAFIGVIHGSKMNVIVQSDSKFLKEFQIDPETFYVFTVKFK